MTDRKTKPPSGEHPKPTTLTSDEWHRVFAYLHSANTLHMRISNAIAKGQQQLTLTDSAVATFIETDIRTDSALWFKLGAIIGQQVGHEG